MMISTLENGKISVSASAQGSDLECDVLVVGAGSAGVYAADSAAREGADVILCEIGENIGGMHVCGHVTGYYYGSNGGSFEEDDKKSAEDTVFLSNGTHWEQRQIRLTERLRKSGVRLLCRHIPTGLYTNGGRVLGIRAFNGSKTVFIRAKITIDATSDGHLIRMTDVKKEYGRASDGSFVPFSIRTQYTKGRKLCSCNADSGKMDHYDVESFSKNTILARANAAALLDRGELVNLALNVGIREGLTFEGEESLRFEDIIAGRSPEKILFWAYSDFDRHGSEFAAETECFQNWRVICNLSTVTVSIPVPLGSIVPKGIRGLVSAGRCLSCDTYSQSAVRMNKDMFRMGECVGIAAAMAALGNTDLLSIDYGEFVTRAKKRECFEGKLKKGFYFDNTYAMYLKKMTSLNRTPDPKYENLKRSDHIYEPIETDVEKNLHLLKTDSPGIAIWSCFTAKDREAVRERIFGLMENAEDSLSRFNYAITSALLGDPRSLPCLREIIRSRDCFFFKDNRRTNQFRSAVAVCLLGRIGEKEDVPLLLEILKKEEFQAPMYHTLKADYLYHSEPDRNFVYFTMITYTCMSLVKIYERHGLPLSELDRIFKDFFSDETVLKRITDAKEGEPAYEELHKFIKYVLTLTGK